VNDVKAFHQENFKMNKSHYPASSKIFKMKLVTWFQHYGAKVHFNYVPMPPDEETGVNSHLRYMVVEHSDLLRDLRYWETLSVASVMLRPVSQLPLMSSIDQGAIQ